MVYRMEVYVDGGCRGNGRPWAYGAAAACFKLRRGGSKRWSRCLPNGTDPAPSNQRAEITAVIVALEEVLHKFDRLDTCPQLDVTIYADSTYAIGCLTDWIYSWKNNGWVNSEGYEVANQDLMREALDLDKRVAKLGRRRYVWIPRGKNGEADGLCKEVMNEMR